MVVKTGSYPWLAYSESSKSLSVETMSLKEDSAGKFQVEIIITDEYDAETTYKQEIILEKPEIATNSTATTNSTSTQNDTVLSPLTEPNETADDSQTSLAHIEVPFFNPSTWTPPQITKKQEISPPLRLDIKGSKDDGTIQLKFNRKVEINPLLLERLSKIS
jgi:hypothetical protein